MTSSLWQPADATRLKCLRELANISANEFAKANAISQAQLDQLEKEGDSAFYSPLIKYQLGKRLLNALDQKTAAESGSAPLNEPITYPNPSGIVKLNKNDQALAMLDKIAEISNRDYNPPIYKTFIQSIRLCWKEHIVFSRACLLIVVILMGTRLLKEPLIALKDKYVLNDVAVIVEDISNNADKKPLASAQPAASSLVSDVAMQAASVPLPISSASDLFLPTPTKDCRWTQTPVTLKSPSPSKPAEYVYLMAINDISACVVGQNKQTTTHTLKAGESQTVNGQAPFRIYSERLADLKIFFQGHRVTVPSPDVTDVLLVESPVER